MDHLKKSFSRTGAKIWNSIPNSGRVLPKYKFKNTPKSWPLNILIQEDTYVGVHTLIDILSICLTLFLCFNPIIVTFFTFPSCLD